MNSVSEKTISIVLPCYNTASCLDALYQRLCLTLENLVDDFEIIMVNDCSPDNDWEIIKELAKKDSRVKGLSLSKNFGQHTAITAGLDVSLGKYVVVMDADLQDQPEEIQKLYVEAINGYDVVLARRSKRKDPFFKKLGSKLFYKVYDFLSDAVTDNSVANFGIYSRKVIDSFCLMREKDRNFVSFIQWLGYKTKYVDVIHAARFAGETSYSLIRQIQLGLRTIISFSNKPLFFSVQLGFWMSLLAFMVGIYFIFKYLILKSAITGWTSLIVSMYFLSGLVLMNLGIVALYIAKIYDEVKHRPLYIVNAIENLEFCDILSKT